MRDLNPCVNLGIATKGIYVRYWSAVSCAQAHTGGSRHESRIDKWPATVVNGAHNRLQTIQKEAVRAFRAASAPRQEAALRNASFEAFQAELMRRYLVGQVEQRTPDWLTDQTECDTQVTAAISGTFTGVVSGAVTLIIGIYVFATISSTMPTPSNPAMANASETVKATTGQAFTLAAVAIIVMVAALILALISGFGRGGGGRGGGQRR